MEEYSKLFDQMVAQAKTAPKKMRVAIAGADCENILRGAFEAEDAGFVTPILIGNYKKIHTLLEKFDLEDRDFDLQPVSDDTSTVQYAIEMINAGKADCLLRGNTQTRDFLLPLLHKGNHLREEDTLMTHVQLVAIPGYEKMLGLSDVTILVHPSMEQRMQVVKNLTYALNVYGVEHPNIALLSLVEKPSFHMRDTVEAQTIVMHHNDEPIADCNLVGPISYDLVISKEAARLKNFDCPYSGDFDGIVVPDLMCGNVMMKVLYAHTEATSCGIIVGAKVPVAIPGRSDRVVQTYLSLATCACDWMKRMEK